MISLPNLSLKRTPTPYMHGDRPWANFPLPNPKQPNKWQADLLEKVSRLTPEERRYLLVIAASGCGKTLLQIFLAILEPDRKHVFITPRRGIAKGYTGGEGAQISLRDTALEWHIDRWDLSNKAAPVQDLEKFLLTPAKEFVNKYPGVRWDACGKSCCTTHASMVKLWGQWKNRPDLQMKALENTSFYCDEGHHGSADEFTLIGNVLSDMLKFNIPTCFLRMMTATFFRGDSREIIDQKEWSKFSRFILPFDTYLEMAGINEIDVNYITYENDPLQEILQQVNANPQNRHLIIIPPRNSRFRWGHLGEMEIVHRLQEGLNAPKDRVLDLVTEGTQSKNLDALLKSPQAWNVVISCELLIEGVDWPPCDVIQNSNPTNSQCRESQTLGRATRAYPGKKKITNNLYVQKQITSDEGINRDLFADRLNVLLMKLLTADRFFPISMPMLPAVKSHVEVLCSHDRDPDIRDIIGSNVVDEIAEKVVMSFDLLDPKTRTVESVRRRLERVAKNFYQKLGLKDIIDKSDFERFVQRIFFRINRLQQGLNPIEPTFMREEGFDEIWKKEDICGCLIFGTKEPLNSDKYMKLRRIIERRMNTINRLEDIKDFFETSAAVVPPKVITPRVDALLPGTWVTAQVDKRRIYVRVIEDQGETVLVRGYKGEIRFTEKEALHTVIEKGKKRVLINDGEDWHPNLPDKTWWGYKHLFKKDQDLGRDIQLQRKWIDGIIFYPRGR